MTTPGRVMTNPGTPWLGRTVFCLGSGDSLRRVAPAQWAGIGAMQLDGAIVLAVNSSIDTARLAGCEPDVLLFTDHNWFEDNEDLVRAFAGPIFTFNKESQIAYPALLRVENIHRHDFAVGHPPMRDGRSSGHRAVSLAVMCGARRVVMLGYDMRVDPVTGRSHCHDKYQHTEPERAYRDEYVPSFTGWYASALMVGCEILNATPGSAVTEFPMLDLDDLLPARVRAA